MHMTMDICIWPWISMGSSLSSLVGTTLRRTSGEQQLLLQSGLAIEELLHVAHLSVLVLR